MKLSFLLLFLVISTSAQNFRVIYEVNYHPQKGSKSVKTELMALDVDLEKHQSIFYNLNRTQRDSLIAVNNFKDLGAIQLPYLEFTLLKTSEKNALYCNTLFGTQYCFDKSSKIQWKIDENHSNTEKEASPLVKDNMKIQYAETEFSGRNWEVSFSPDLSIIDGPYFFKGLPGLILTAKSKDGDYAFRAVSIGKISNEESKFSTFKGKKNIKEKKYIDFLKKFQENPALFNLDMTNEYNDVFKYQYSGKKDKSYDEMNRFVKERFERYNNPIDENLPIFIVNN